jgi:serine O-acetyltransferase
MIKTKKDLNFYLKEEMHRAGFESISKYYLSIWLGKEQAHTLRYLRNLRHYEYYHNTNHKFLEIFFHIKHLRMSIRYGIHIGLNMVGYGFWMPHFAGGIIVNCLKMGNYCSASGGVVIGNKDSEENKPTIGNEVSFHMGCKIYGKINIGDNVRIAPNSVVINDIPSNVAVSGIPTKVIKNNISKRKIYFFD